jgi:hypothetical protein
MNALAESPMGFCDEANDIFKKLNLLADFGADKCEWIPFWDAAKYVNTSENILTSIYKRQDGAMICAIVNNCNSTNVGWIDFGKNKDICLKPGATCNELVSGKPVDRKGNRISISLPPYAGTMVKIE